MSWLFSAHDWTSYGESAAFVVVHLIPEDLQAMSLHRVELLDGFMVKLITLIQLAPKPVQL